MGKKQPAKMEPCPFCGKPLINRKAGPFNPLGLGEYEAGPMHYNPDCLLNGLDISENWLLFNIKKWNTRALPQGDKGGSIPKPCAF